MYKDNVTKLYLAIYGDFIKEHINTKCSKDDIEDTIIQLYEEVTEIVRDEDLLI